jgi:hypothetical protein
MVLGTYVAFGLMCCQIARGGFMKIVAAILLSMTGLLLGSSAMANGQGEDLCMGGYSYPLVTRTECKSYLDRRRLLEQRKDMEALKNLDADYAIMLKERSEVCPCVAESMRRARSIINVAHLR